MTSVVSGGGASRAPGSGALVRCGADSLTTLATLPSVTGVNPHDLVQEIGGTVAVDGPSHLLGQILSGEASLNADAVDEIDEVALEIVGHWPLGAGKVLQLLHEAIRGVGSGRQAEHFAFHAMQPRVEREQILR